MSVHLGNSQCDEIVGTLASLARSIFLLRQAMLVPHWAQPIVLSFLVQSFVENLQYWDDEGVERIGHPGVTFEIIMARNPTIFVEMAINVLRNLPNIVF